MNRRDFLEKAAGTTFFALATQRKARAASPHAIEKVGLQLYTVRGEMKRDFEGTLAKVAEIGYREVEFAGLFDHSPNNVRGALDRNGLAGVSSHVDLKSLGEPWPKVLDGAHIIGQKYIICPWMDEKDRTLEGVKRVAESFNRAGEAAKKAGIQFGYHNHDFEFRPLGDNLLYDVLLRETDANFVKMEMDLCWITVGGQDPLAYFGRYPGRFPLVHVKDMTKEHQMTEVGSGAIDWKRIFAQSEKAGIQHYFVEHDEPKAPFDSIHTSYDYLRKLRF